MGVSSNPFSSQEDGEEDGTIPKLDFSGEENANTDEHPGEEEDDPDKEESIDSRVTVGSWDGGSLLATNAFSPSVMGGLISSTQNAANNWRRVLAS